MAYDLKFKVGITIKQQIIALNWHHCPMKMKRIILKRPILKWEKGLQLHLGKFEIWCINMLVNTFDSYLIPIF